MATLQASRLSLSRPATSRSIRAARLPARVTTAVALPSAKGPAKKMVASERGPAALSAAAGMGAPGPADPIEVDWLTRTTIGAEKAINGVLCDSVVFLLDKLYSKTERAYARFYVLETIARVPYFSYASVLHLYETLGWVRRADYLKVHFAQSWNELHHLLIMESLGGNEQFLDRFFAQHAAVVYYWLICGFYLASPRMAYNFMELVETHAYETYNEFLTANEAMLRAMPAPEVAKHYYHNESGDHYMFDEFQTALEPGARRPVIASLYDVFVNIREDEAAHTHTMQLCQSAAALVSPHEAAYLKSRGACPQETSAKPLLAQLLSSPSGRADAAAPDENCKV